MTDAKTAFYDAKQIAKSKGYFVVAKPTCFLLFREAVPNNVFVAKRTTSVGMLQLVKQVCVDKPNN